MQSDPRVAYLPPPAPTINSDMINSCLPKAGLQKAVLPAQRHASDNGHPSLAIVPLSSDPHFAGEAGEAWNPR
jgi:hypothetical protein